MPDHAAFRFVTFAVETCGYKEAVKFVNRLGDIAAKSGRIKFPEGICVRCAMQLLSVMVQRGNAEM